MHVRADVFLGGWYECMESHLRLGTVCVHVCVLGKLARRFSASRTRVGG